MNKTININLGGFFFHIDESAFKKLRRYLDAISKSLSDDPQGKNEIIADIEARISELLSEKITDERQVVNENDIDAFIQKNDVSSDFKYRVRYGNFSKKEDAIKIAEYININLGYECWIDKNEL